MAGFRTSRHPALSVRSAAPSHTDSPQTDALNQHGDVVPTDIVHLQRLIGNRAMQEMLMMSRAPAAGIQRFILPTLTAVNTLQQAAAIDNLSDEELANRIQETREQRNALEPGDPQIQRLAITLSYLLKVQARRKLDATMEALLDAKGEDHEKLALEMIDLIRAEVDSLSNLVDAFKAQKKEVPAVDDPDSPPVMEHDPSAKEKVRVLGEFSALIARMEYLAGTIYHQGGNWETTDVEGKKEGKSNRGPVLDYYKKQMGLGGYNWCAAFASKMLSKARRTSKTVAASGLKISHPQQVDTENYQFKYDGEGGEYSGIGNRVGKAYYKTTGDEAAAKKNTRVNFNPWAGLRESLEEIEDDASSKLRALRSGAAEEGVTEETIEQEKREKLAEAADEFVSSNMTPQAGDIMDINPKAKHGVHENAYRPADGGLGHHTTLIEHYDSTERRLYTIEGNTSGRVSGYAYDLTNVEDVRLIIGVARPGLDSGTAQDAAEDERQRPVTPGTFVTEHELLDPVREVNKKLQNLGVQMGVVHEAVEGYEAKVAQLEGPGTRSRSGNIDDN